MNVYNETRKYEAYFANKSKAKSDRIAFYGFIAMIVFAAITLMIRG